VKQKPEHAANAGSFRDPAGFVFAHKGTIYRQVNKAGKPDYEYFIKSGLYAKLAGEGLMVAHEEVILHDLPADPERYKIIKPTKIPFITYPYEWCFSQLKSAALLTMHIQKTAIGHGMILKDASAYNVQFFGNRALFIDSLSFRVYKPGAPWDGYRQYCEHFITPLAMAAYGYIGAIKALRANLDGIPLAEAARTLPARARLRRGLAVHLYLHATSRRRYDSRAEDGTKERKVSKLAMSGLISSLEKTVKRLDPPKQTTQWGEYYSDTNYSESAFKAKRETVAKKLMSIKPMPRIVWDLGANDGTFSEIAAAMGIYTLAFDIDPGAVELNFAKERSPVMAGLLLPVLQDLANPSPALGWAHGERLSLEQRGPADVLVVLALIHHLAIGNNLPLERIAEYFSGLGKFMIIEFVPRSDSKAKILLRHRANMFHDYTASNFERVFSRYFTIVEKEAVTDSQRVIYLLKSKTNFKRGQKTQSPA